jgi:hypothetical protein
MESQGNGPATEISGMNEWRRQNLLTQRVQWEQRRELELRYIPCVCGRVMGYQFGPDRFVCGYRNDRSVSENRKAMDKGCGRAITGQEYVERNQARDM